MAEQDQQIAKISALLNSAIRSKNSKDYKAAVAMLEKCSPKPSLQQILNSQEIDNQNYQEELKIQKAMKKINKKEKLLKEAEDIQSSKSKKINPDDAESIKLEDMTIGELERELENLRKEHGDEIDKLDSGEKSQQELEEEEEQRVQDVIKRYEKTFGRIKDLGSYKSNSGSVAGKSVTSSKKSKNSKNTEFSTVSQREAFEKLKKLDEEEEKIKKEKEELMKFLELRSQSSKCSSRPVTVSTILSKNPEPIEKSSFPVKKQQEKHETAENKLESIPEVQKVNKKKKEKSEVSDLFKNL